MTLLLMIVITLLLLVVVTVLMTIQAAVVVAAAIRIFKACIVTVIAAPVAACLKPLPYILPILVVAAGGTVVLLPTLLHRYSRQEHTRPDT